MDTMREKKLYQKIDLKVRELESHRIYAEINSLSKLRFFMERHVFAVFDFMSLTKAMQKEFSPVELMWTPPKNSSLARFINEIVLCEESDLGPCGRPLSHFEMYCQAMAEVKANSDLPQIFIHHVREKGVKEAINFLNLPRSAKGFMKSTFDTIENRPIHEIAASFCFGREKIIPKMFISLLKRMDICEKSAPLFYYYLQRHVEVDGDSHGPLAVQMIHELCGNDEKKWDEAANGAMLALEARILFWDDIVDELATQYD